MEIKKFMWVLPQPGRDDEVSRPKPVIPPSPRCPGMSPLASRRVCRDRQRDAFAEFTLSEAKGSA
jgi:hypothetical protein